MAEGRLRLHERGRQGGYCCCRFGRAAGRSGACRRLRPGWRFCAGRCVRPDRCAIESRCVRAGRRCPEGRCAVPARGCIAGCCFGSTCCRPSGGRGRFGHGGCSGRGCRCTADVRSGPERHGTGCCARGSLRAGGRTAGGCHSARACTGGRPSPAGQQHARDCRYRQYARQPAGRPARYACADHAGHTHRNAAVGRYAGQRACAGRTLAPAPGCHRNRGCRRQLPLRFRQPASPAGSGG